MPPGAAPVVGRTGVLLAVRALVAALLAVLVAFPLLRLATVVWTEGADVAGILASTRVATAVRNTVVLASAVTVANGRGNGALAKIGAVKEAILRRSFLRGGRHHDQSLWSIVREDWRQAKAVWGAAGSAVH